MMKQLAVIGAIGVFSTCLCGQGLNTNQTKEQWEEINFEFNSSILSDGYPSLLRLGEILSQHRDYHVKLVGNTDYVGSARYNDRLAMRRAETVRLHCRRLGPRSTPRHPHATHRRRAHPARPVSFRSRLHYRNRACSITNWSLPEPVRGISP